MSDKAVSGSVTIREDLAPLFIITFVGVPTDAQFDAYLAHLARITVKLEPRALIFDASASGPTPAAHRKRMADWMKQYEPHIRANTVGAAFVLPSAIMRGVLTAILWVQPMACPHNVVASLGEAKLWAKDMVDKRLGLSGQGAQP